MVLWREEQKIGYCEMLDFVIWLVNQEKKIYLTHFYLFTGNNKLRIESVNIVNHGLGKICLIIYANETFTNLINL